MNSVNLTDNFLIAMPALEDPYFSNALVYICEHNENGALGIIVNRPIDMSLAGLLEKIDIKLEAESWPTCRSISAVRCSSIADSCCIVRTANGNRRSR